MNLKISLFPKLIIVFLLFSFPIITNAAGVQQDDQEKEITKNVASFQTESNFYTFSDIKNIEDVPGLFKFFRNFISWRHWRFWVSIIISIFAYFLMVFIIPDPRRIFSKENAERFRKRESNVYLSIWLIYSIAAAVLFTFQYEHFLAFFENATLKTFYTIPVDQHTIFWVLWSGLILLATGAMIDIIYNLIVFKLMAFYVLISHLLQGVFLILAVFLLTNVITYMIIGLGIIIGGIVASIIGISILVAILGSSPESVSSAINNPQKMINENARKEGERMKKLYKESLKNPKVWKTNKTED